MNCSEIFALVQQARFAELGQHWDAAVSSYAKLGHEPRTRAISLRGLARVYQCRSDYAKALTYLRQLTEVVRNRSIRQMIAASEPRGILCSRPKLKHDLEQLEYLIARGIFSTADRKRYAGYREVFDLAGRFKNSRFRIEEDALRALGRKYYLADHVYAPPAVDGPALRRHDAAELERRYRANRDTLVVDDLLSNEALERLRHAVHESTYWFDIKQGGYVGAYSLDGFASELMFQIASEIRKRLLPNILRDHWLWEMWAYKYDQNMHGIRLHADAAAVNVNFWITPDEANRDPQSGGMIIYPVVPPQNWKRFTKYNSYSRERTIEQYLADRDVEAIRIPYRANRAVIFNSLYFHKTDDLSFHSGFASRRVNITLLYGNPQNDPVFWYKYMWTYDRI